METQLSIVNHLLQTAGERRVITLETGNPSVLQAVQAVESASRDIQAHGWWFNTNRAFRLLPNNIGEIQLPNDCLSFTIARHVIQYQNVYNKTRFSRRGTRIYDSQNNTFNIGQYLDHLYVDMVMELAIEDLPQIAASYIKHYAAEAYCVDDDGDKEKVAKLSERTMLAYHSLKAAQMRSEATNALDSPSAQQLRYRIRSGGYNGNPYLPGGGNY